MLKASYVFYYIILVIIPSGNQVGTVSSAIVLILKIRISFTATDILGTALCMMLTLHLLVR